jgi:hypothetical protein
MYIQLFQIVFVVPRLILDNPIRHGDRTSEAYAGACQLCHRLPDKNRRGVCRGVAIVPLPTGQEPARRVHGRGKRASAYR